MGKVSRETSPLGHTGSSGLEGKVLLSMGYPVLPQLGRPRVLPGSSKLLALPAAAGVLLCHGSCSV